MSHDTNNRPTPELSPDTEKEVSRLHKLLWDSLVAFGASSGYATPYPMERG